MSELLRIAVVAEGPTDTIVIEAALRAIVTDQPFVLTQLQPEGSLAFGETGGGWGGVYRWCKQSLQRGNGRLANDRLVLDSFDVLVIHLDADVAGRKYADSTITPNDGDRKLPCEYACPPPAATTDALRAVLLSWCAERQPPPRVVLCVPSKAMEAWVVASLFPSDAAVIGATAFECFAAPESRLAQQPKRKRIRKAQSDYRDSSAIIQNQWPRIAAPTEFGEAYRFQCDMLAALPRP